MYNNSTRIPVEVSFVTFHDDDLPVSAVAEYRKEPDRRASVAGGNGSGSGPGITFSLTTGSFPQEIIVSTLTSFANLKKIELTLDEAKDIVVERCLYNSDGSTSTSSTGADPMSATYEVIGERRLGRGEEVSSSSAPAAARKGGDDGSANNANKKTPGMGNNDDLKPRKPQVEVLELDPSSAGKGIRAIKLKIMSGYSDFVGILGIALYGEESEQRIAVLESKAEVNM